MGHYRYSILILSLLFLISCFRLIASEQLLVVGENYVGRYADRRFQVIFEAPLSSQTFFPERCEVVVREKNTGIHRVVPGNLTLRPGGELLLDVSQGEYLTTDSNRVISLRNGKHEIEATLPWNFDDEIVAASPSRGGFALLSRAPKGPRVAVHFVNSDLKWLSRMEIPSGKDQFPHYHLREADDGSLWAAFSKTVPGATYVPYVAHLRAEKGIEEYEWKERGLLLDICVRPEGTYVTRDIPSMPFTVPLVSQLEKIDQGKKNVLHSFEPNELPESIACGADTFYFAQRSLTGSRNTLLVLQRNAGQSIIELPDRVRRLYLCR